MNLYLEAQYFATNTGAYARFLEEFGQWHDTVPISFQFQGKPRQCFDNAWEGIEHYNLGYAQGYIVVAGIPLDHSWNIQPNGQPCDATPLAEPPQAYFGVEFSYEGIRNLFALAVKAQVVTYGRDRLGDILPLLLKAGYTAEVQAALLKTPENDKGTGRE
ncbi:MAG: hypothetical protein WAZ18_01890 [Alphaproteobacteria bacterium]